MNVQPHRRTALIELRSLCRILLTVRQFAEKHPAFPLGSLRNLIFLAKDHKTSHGYMPGNGLSGALVRIGRKLLIDEEQFFKWIEQQQKRRIVDHEVPR